MTELAILVPVLNRPHRVAPLLESIATTTPACRVLFLASGDDSAEIEALEAASADYLPIGRMADRGQYATKINYGYRTTLEPLLFLAADDLLFHPGWYQAAVTQLAPGIGVVGTNDLGNQRVIDGRHSTHSLVTRAYIDEHGTIDQPRTVLHEGYWHEWVDDEFIGTARHRNALAFAPNSIVEHLHPSWGKADSDDLYAMQRHRMHRSRPLFMQRRHLWGD